MNQNDQMREALRREFPLLDEIGLDQELHHCEWSIQRERNRLHQLLDELQTEQTLSCVNKTPKNEHDSCDVLNKVTKVDMMREALQQIANTVEEPLWYQEVAEKALAAEPATQDEIDCHIKAAYKYMEDVVRQSNHLDRLKKEYEKLSHECSRLNLVIAEMKKQKLAATKLVRLTKEQLEFVAMLRASQLHRLMTAKGDPEVISEAFNDIAEAIMEEIARINR